MNPIHTNRINPESLVAATPPEVCVRCNELSLLLTGIRTKQSIHYCQHNKNFIHVSKIYKRSDYPITTWKVKDSKQDALMAQKATQTIENRSTPEWVFREIVARQWWELGDLSNPTKVKHVSGFNDFRYAIRNTWRDVSILQLPGVKLNKQEHDDRGFDPWAVSMPIEAGNGLYVTSGPFTGFSSDNAADKEMLRQCRKETKRLEDLRDIAQQTGDRSSELAAQAALGSLASELVNYFVPGGGLKKLNAGDPLDKACDAARKRKKRAIKQLKDFGLADMASHWHASYSLHPRSFAYCPNPDPKWFL